MYGKKSKIKRVKKTNAFHSFSFFNHQAAPLDQRPNPHSMDMTPFSHSGLTSQACVVPVCSVKAGGGNTIQQKLHAPFVSSLNGSVHVAALLVCHCGFKLSILLADILRTFVCEIKSTPTEVEIHCAPVQSCMFSAKLVFENCLLNTASH